MMGSGGIVVRPLLALADIRLEMQEKTILDGISFAVSQGDIVGILGASGSGKTSLFRIINLLQSPTGGTVFYRDKDTLTYAPTTLRREIGYVFQKTYLFGSTVAENLLYPYQLMQQKPDFQEIADYLDKVNLPAAVQAKNVNELSGG
jgi:putative ABC transport system ATP-binding protein